MCKIKKTDFYYGAFLSALLNSPGGRPSLFDETESRRIYKLETNNSPECYVYTKYAKARDNQTDRFDHWTFNFRADEVEKLQELFNKKQHVKLVLICIKEGLADSEIAILNFDEAMKCVGVERGVRTHRIDIKAIDGKKGLKAYGSGLSDKINGKDNTLQIPRKRLKEL